MFFAQPISQYALRHAGFENAVIGSAGIEDGAFVLSNARLSDAISFGAIRLTAAGGLTIESPKIALSRPAGDRPDGAAHAPSPAGRERAMALALLPHITPITITNGILTINTPQGEIPLSFGGTLAEQAESYQWASPLTSASPLATLDGKLTVSLDKRTHDIKAHLEIADTKITMPDVEVRRLSGWISAEIPATDPPVLNSQLAAGNIKAGGITLQGGTLSLSTTPRKAELLLAAKAANNAGDIALDAKIDFTTNKGTLDFTADVRQKVTLDAAAKLAFAYDPALKKLSFTGTATPKPGLPAMKIKGAHDAGAMAGSAEITLPPSSGEKLHELYPDISAWLSETKGTVGMTAHIAWSGGAIKTSGDLLLKDASTLVKKSAITGINTVLHFSSLLPPVFKNQSVAIGALDAGIPLTNGEVQISLDRANNFTLHNASWAVAKGTITSSPFTLSLKDMNTDVTLTATNLDLVELFRLAPMEGLDATGTANGVLPLRIRDGQAEIVEGVLETTGGGAIRYSPKQVPAFLQDTSKKQIVDLRVALEAFEYDSLKLTISGAAGKSQKISLQAKGKNPKFYEGRPVNLNFNVEGPLENVLKYNPGNSRIPDSIQQRIEEYERTHAK